MQSETSKRVHVGAAWRVILAEVGLDPATVLRRAGLPKSLFSGSGSYVSVDDFYALHEAVESESSDSTVALKGGTLVSTESFDPARFAAVCSPDLNTALLRLADYKRLVSVFRLDVAVGDRGTTVGYRCELRPDVPLTLGLSELVFLVAFARRATRHAVAPTQVSVQRLPPDCEPFERFFECPLKQASSWTVTFRAEDATRAFLTHDDRIWESFEPTLRRHRAEPGREDSVGEQVEAALFELLPSGRATVQDVSRELGVGMRTLQRRLSAEGTTWIELLNRTRERLARHYLESTAMSPSEVSFLLGYEDPNSLFRAFRRWTGTSPEAWRADARNPD